METLANDDGRRGTRELASSWSFVMMVAVGVGLAAHWASVCSGEASRPSGRSTLKVPGSGVRSLVFDGDGKRLGVLTADGSVSVWDLSRGVGRSLPTTGVEQEHCGAFSPDGNILAAGRDGESVVLYNPRTGVGRPLIDPDRVTVGAKCLAFAPDGRSLAVGHGHGRISIWDVSTRRLRSMLRGHVEVVGSLAYGPDSEILASSGGDRTVRLWDLDTGDLVRSIPDQPGMYVALAIGRARDRRLLAMADLYHSGVRLWDLDEGRERPPLLGARHSLHAVAISPDGRAVAAADYCGNIRTWDLNTGRLDPVSMVHPGTRALAFAPDRHTLATGGFDGVIHLWDWPR